MRYLPFFFLLLFSFCKSFEPDHLVVAPSASIFEYPDPGSAAVAVLQANEGLLDMGKVSRFETTLEMDQSQTTMPWMEMQNQDGKKGWVWMGWIRPFSTDSMAWIQDKRLMCYLGNDLYRQTQNLHNLSEQTPLAEKYSRAINLRDSILYVLHHRPEDGLAGQPDDWIWLTKAMPGFVFQRIDSGVRPYLFSNYPYWLQRALETPEKVDDLFFETMCLVYPTDSIESFFPVWTIQTDENKGCSQLGLGRHDAMLKRLDEAMVSSPSFEPELFKVKNLLLEDIFGKEDCYWQNEKNILTELNMILDNQYKCLSSRDVIALKARKDMFENPAANGILVDIRAGG